MHNKDMSIINKIFTIPYIDKMIEDNSTPQSFYKCIRRCSKMANVTYGTAIKEIYRYMNIKYRNEYFFKNTILNGLLINKHDLCDTAALSELPICESKADFVMINGQGIVYEIKTDLDSLVRLNHQIRDYYKVFSYVYVVVGSKYIDKIKDNLELQSVGIYELTKSGRLVQRKKAYCNREYLTYETMFQLLRKSEFESILLKHYKKLPEVNNFLYYRECQKWIGKVNIITLQKEVMECLKKRTLLKEGDELEEKVPYELRFYAYFSKKYKLNYEAIDEFLHKEMEE